MEKLLKQSILVFVATSIVTLVMFSFNASLVHAGYDVASANNKHTGFYFGGTLGGLDIPTGPDEDGYSLGFNWELRVGYQFLRYLAIEGNFHESSGSFNHVQYNTLSGAQEANGLWYFIDGEVLDLKPIIPLSLRNNLYFIVGFSRAYFSSESSNLSSNVTISSHGIAYEIGMGFEGYVTNHISLGGELVYHNFINNTFTVDGAPVNGNIGDITTPYDLNMSFTSLNFVFLYHL